MWASIDKKNKYLVYSILVGIAVFLFSYGQTSYRPVFAFIAMFITVVGVFATQYPTIKLSNVSAHVLLPMHLTVGALLSLIYFPNLSFLIKVLLILVFTVCLYVISLINNVFLVVEEREESIPLFRAAVTWVQILLAVIAIPFFAGIFKLPIDALQQNLIVSISSILFSFYLIWVFKLDPEFKIPSAGEKIALSLFTFFCIFSLGSAISFFPTESFLRAVFLSSILMFCVNYIQSHLKNSINKNLLIQHFFISVIFFIILIIFNP